MRQVAQPPVVLDEPQHGRELPVVVVDEPPLRVRRDHQQRHPDAQAELVDLRRRHVVVEPAPVVPRQEDRRVLPHGAAHDGVDDLGGPVLSPAEVVFGVLGQGDLGRDPRDRGEPARLHVAHEIVDRSAPAIPFAAPPDVTHGVVCGPDVALLLRCRRVVRPGDALPVELVPERAKVEARRDLGLMPLGVQGGDQGPLLRVAAPALQHVRAAGTGRKDRVLHGPARLRRDREEVIGERGAVHRCEEAVAEDVVLRPLPEVGQLVRMELGVRVELARSVPEAIHLAPVVGQDGEDVRAGERLRLSLVYVSPEDIDPDPGRPLQPEELDRRLDMTIKMWRRWSSKGRLDSPDGPAAIRSALVLKGLTRAPTGAIAAAATTSLPEALGGDRNWDYRYSWIRDSWLTVRSLAELGYEEEADGFRRFIERSAAGHAADLQIVYGVGGERRLIETTVDDLEGYRRSAPVRVGNDAHTQDQHDVFGSILELAYQWHLRGHSPDDDYWAFLVDLVDRAAESWMEKDPGIWELRARPMHFVHSKVMCWAALDRGILLARECARRAPVRRWTTVRDRIRRSVDRDGYDRRRGVFVRAYGTKAMDAALLLLPVVGYCAFDDERMVRTTDLIRKELGRDGLLRRYRSADGMPGQEGEFLAAQFWLAEALARQGRIDDAREEFDRGMATGNDLDLFSEEFDPKQRIALGNFPQGLTHLAH